MICPGCGKHQRDNPSYCRWCGQRLGITENPRMSVSRKESKIAKKVLFGLIAVTAFSLVMGAAVNAVFNANVDQNPQVSAALPVRSEVQMYGVGELHGVIIGVSDYLYLDDIPGPDDGSRQIYQQLGELWGEQAHLRLLVDDGATRTNIEEAMIELAQEDDADDTVLFYFTGHGDENYMAPYDSSPTSYSRNISAGLLDRWLDVLDSRRVIIVIDSCRAGAYAEKLSQDGRVVLASCAANEDATTELSSYLIAGFSDPGKVDTNVDGQLSVEELFAYVKSQRIQGQHPCMFDGCPGEFVLVSGETG